MSAGKKIFKIAKNVVLLWRRQLFIYDINYFSASQKERYLNYNETNQEWINHHNKPSVMLFIIL